MKELIEPFPLKIWVLFELLLISNELDNWSGTPRKFAALVETKFNWALDPPLFITRGVAAEALMVKPCDWSVSPMFKMPTVWVALSITVRAAVMLFVKFAVAEVPLAVMLPDQFVVSVQFPFTFAVQFPLWARKLGAKARITGTKSAKAILGSFQFCEVVFFIVLWGRDWHFLFFWVRRVLVCIVQQMNIRSIIEHGKALHLLVKGGKVGKIMVRHFYHKSWVDMEVRLCSCPNVHRSARK